jgi:hypothetical protein
VTDMNQLIRDGVARRRRQPRDEHGRRVITDDAGHDDPRVAPLVRARAEAEAIGDEEFAAELDRKIRSVAPEYARRIEGVDGGAVRGQGGLRPQVDVNAAMNAWARALIRHQRKRLAEEIDAELD